ncbi:hypothetical protein M5689_018631 [Euphorbia peplus]|nr:hypothetical protein M5689_018631 [Euphorbia peplus]
MSKFKRAHETKQKSKSKNEQITKKAWKPIEEHHIPVGVVHRRINDALHREKKTDWIEDDRNMDIVVHENPTNPPLNIRALNVSYRSPVHDEVPEHERGKHQIPSWAKEYDASGRMWMKLIQVCLSIRILMNPLLFNSIRKNGTL